MYHLCEYLQVKIEQYFTSFTNSSASLQPNFHAPLVKVRDESARHHYHHQSGDPSFVQIYDDDDDDIEDIFDGDNEDDGARWNGINERIVNHGVAKHNLKIGQCESSQVNGINGTSNRDLDSFEGSKKEGGSKFKVVGKPMVHLSAFKQTSGEAVYVDDMPSYKGQQSLSSLININESSYLSSHLQMNSLHRLCWVPRPMQRSWTWITQMPWIYLEWWPTWTTRMCRVPTISEITWAGQMSRSLPKTWWVAKDSDREFKISLGNCCKH